MVFRKIFHSIYPQPDSVPAELRKATLYLLRCVFLMGIRTPPQHLTSHILSPIGFVMGYMSHFSDLSPGENLTSLQVTFNAWACSTKVIVVWVLVKRFDLANLALDKLDRRLTKPSEWDRPHRALSGSNRIFFCFMTVYLLYATNTFLSSIAMGVPMLQNYYPWLDWLCVQSVEYFALMGACFQDVCVDCYPIYFVLPLRAHLGSFADRLLTVRQ
ncbi:GH21470 [Drosophila grimshawi]|uniref:GH21470 n=1 Tax=Drosophila grimshawi TaxID=7222 RepID=B4J9T7_DROGR|nr:GH21470 [Drosophila grimshawi]